MKRRVIGSSADEAGEWVVALDCVHRQHVRHQPPFRQNPWVESAEGRAEHVGMTLDCPLCDRCEMPNDLVVAGTTPQWTETSVPTALLKDHRIGAGTWGRLRVGSGSLRFRAETDPITDVIVPAGQSQSIPPGVEHRVSCGGPVLFSIDFLVPDEGAFHEGRMQSNEGIAPNTMGDAKPTP